jgi:hypothetical protein
MAIIKLNTNVKEINVIGKLTGLSEGHALHNSRVCKARIEDTNIYFILDSSNKVRWLDVFTELSEFFYIKEYEFFKNYQLNEDIYYNQMFTDTELLTDNELYQNQPEIEDQLAEIKLLESVK